MSKEVITGEDIDKALGRDVVASVAPAPQFKHDCDACVFLGRVAYQDVWSENLIDCDIYHCPREVTGATILARYGDEGREYSSFPREILESKQREGLPMGSHTPALMMGLLLMQHRERVALEKGGPCKECGDPSPKGHVFCGAACCHEYERKNS